MKFPIAAAAALAVLAAAPASAGETPSAPGTEVYIVNLSDGDVVNGSVPVIFGLRGMGVAPAGVEAENTGHHHILLNRAPFGEGPEDAEYDEVGLPADDNHKHFGGGQTEAVLELPPGEHTLQLVFADHFHVPHDPPVMSEQITITVK
ncbi:MAG: DUF4399 domain-containing protein [Pseudomonadota bacterium]